MEKNGFCEESSRLKPREDSFEKLSFSVTSVSLWPELGFGCGEPRCEVVKNRRDKGLASVSHTFRVACSSRLPRRGCHPSGVLRPSSWALARRQLPRDDHLTQRRCDGLGESSVRVENICA